MEKTKENRIQAGTAFGYFFAIIALLSLIYAAFFAPAGFFNTDEFIYAAMTENLVENGSLFFDNGYEENPSESLQLWFLQPGKKGLTPQYPSGYAFFAAPFFILAGIRGIILLNTLAALGIVWLTYRLADLLFDNKTLALYAAVILSLASFLCDYAFAIMPHATSSLCILAAVYFTALSAKSNRRPFTHVFIAGLFIGAGIHFRVDVIISAPLLMAWTFVSASSPVRRISLLVAGLLPGLAAASWLNHLKFGSLNPLTYGSGKGLTSFSAYGEFIPYILIGVLVVFALRFRKVQDQLPGIKGGLIVGIGLALFAFIPTSHEFAVRLFKGMYVLLINLQSYDYIASVSGNPILNGEFILFSGQVKKALFESIPFAGFIILPLAAIFRHKSRAAHVLLILIPIGLFFFYSVNQWHGGQSTNMRYFTPVLPFIAILTASAWQQLREPGAHPQKSKTFATLSPLPLIFLLLIPEKYYSVHLSTLLLSGTVRMLFYLTILIAVLILIKPAYRPLKSLGKGVMLVTLAMAFVNGYLHDLRVGHSNRTSDISQRVACSAIERNALVITTLPRHYFCHLLHIEGQLAVFDKSMIKQYPDLIDWNLNRNNPVYADESTIQNLEKEDVGFKYRFEQDTSAGNNLYRIGQQSNNTFKGETYCDFINLE